MSDYKWIRKRIAFKFEGDKCDSCKGIVYVDLYDKNREEKFIKIIQRICNELAQETRKTYLLTQIRLVFWMFFIFFVIFAIINLFIKYDPVFLFIIMSMVYGIVYILNYITWHIVKYRLRKINLKKEIDSMIKEVNN